MYRIALISEDYGLEWFEYETLIDASLGFERLKKQSQDSFDNDSIYRTVLLCLESFETE